MENKTSKEQAIWFLIISQTLVDKEIAETGFVDTYLLPINVGLYPSKHMKNGDPVPALMDWYKEEVAVDDMEMTLPNFKPKLWYWQVGTDEDNWDNIMIAAEKDPMPFIQNFKYVEESPTPGIYVRHNDWKTLFNQLTQKGKNTNDD